MSGRQNLSHPVLEIGHLRLMSYLDAGGVRRFKSLSAEGRKPGENWCSPVLYLQKHPAIRVNSSADKEHSCLVVLAVQLS